jgi:hypothetical protein
MAGAISQLSRFECPVEAMIVSFLDVVLQQSFLLYFNFSATSAENPLS